MTRRKMKFCSPGPLVEDDQHKLAVFINGLCKNKYLNKPINLTTYEYDVLYPEVSFQSNWQINFFSIFKFDLI